MKTLLIGASGLLGRNLKIEADRPTHQKLDIRGIIIPEKYETVILSAAYTDVTKAENDRWNCFNINVNGVLNVMESYPTTPLVYISTEYAKNPVNFYSLTKSMAEQMVIFHHASYLIIRTLFKPYPYPYKYAFTDQFTQGDTIDIIAPLIDKEISEWDRKMSKVVYVGTGRKTMFQLARKSKPDVLPNSILDMKITLPHDYQ